MIRYFWVKVIDTGKVILTETKSMQYFYCTGELYAYHISHIKLLEEIFPPQEEEVTYAEGFGRTQEDNALNDAPQYKENNKNSSEDIRTLQK